MENGIPSTKHIVTNPKLRERYWDLETMVRNSIQQLVFLSTKLNELAIKYSSKKDLISNITIFYKLITDASQTLQEHLLQFNKSTLCYVAVKLVLSTIGLITQHCIDTVAIMLKEFRVRHIDTLTSEVMMFEITDMLMESAINSDPNYLFFLPSEHPDWKLLRQAYEADV